MTRRSIVYLGVTVIFAFTVAVFLTFSLEIQRFDDEIKLAETKAPITEGGPGLVESEPDQIILPPALQHEVPFTSQAPFANWNDRRYQNACEEASILMVWKWITGETLTAEEANQTIADMVDFQQENYGFFIDSSAEDTARLLREYYQYEGVFIDKNVTVERIKAELARGNLVIVPVDGTKLVNPFFTPPGPNRHMLVLTGYSDSEQVFIVNDPGTRRGEDFKYSYNVLGESIRDYESGDHVPVSGEERIMIVIENDAK